MGYRFYTSREFARLNAADAARRAKMERFNRPANAPVIEVKSYRLPIQNQLAAVLHLVQEDRLHLANMYLKMRTLSPKQTAAAQRWIDRTKAKKA